MKRETLFQSKLTRLIKSYVRIAIILVLFLSSSTFIFFYTHNSSLLNEDLNDKNQFVFEQLNNYDTKNKQIAYNLVSSEDKLSALTNYFNQSYSEYATHYLMGEEKYFFPDDIYYLYSQDSYLEGVHITLHNSPINYYSVRDNRFGLKTNDIPEIKGIRFSLPLYYSSRTQEIGTITFYYHPNILKNDPLNEIETYLINPVTNQVMYPYEFDRQLIEAVQSGKESPIYKYKIREINGLVRIVSYYSTKDILAHTLKLGWGVFFLSLVVSISLYYFQRQLFSDYTEQVQDLVDTLKKIGEGNIDERIDEANKENEMLLISNEVNRMLDSEQQHVKEIFALKIKQQEAYIKALQAQINPHFFYNTLEFFRMTALLEESDELADMIYDFSALMRNSISQEMYISIKKEIEFCQKYLNLYQQRYPNKLTVQIEIDKTVEETVVPKFSIQPLVENYIVHGVDWSRIDNILSIRVSQSSEKQVDYVNIVIADNGDGMTQAKIDEINNKFQRYNKPIHSNSIGIEIVYQQLLNHYGKHFSMSYQLIQEGGVLVCMKLPVEQS